MLKESLRELLFVKAQTDEDEALRRKTLRLLYESAKEIVAETVPWPNQAVAGWLTFQERFGRGKVTDAPGVFDSFINSRSLHRLFCKKLLEEIAPQGSASALGGLSSYAASAVGEIPLRLKNADLRAKLLVYVFSDEDFVDEWIRRLHIEAIREARTFPHKQLEIEQLALALRIALRGVALKGAAGFGITERILRLVESLDPFVSSMIDRSGEKQPPETGAVISPEIVEWYGPVFGSKKKIGEALGEPPIQNPHMVDDLIEEGQAKIVPVHRTGWHVWFRDQQLFHAVEKNLACGNHVKPRQTTPNNGYSH